MICNELSKVHFALPSIYEDSLSYYEEIRNLCEEVNKAIDLIQQYEQNYKAYTDGKIAELDNKITQQLNDTVKNLNLQYRDFIDIVNNNLAIYSTELDKIKTDLKNQIIAVNQRTELLIEQNNEYILSKISEGLVNIKVLNPFTGVYVGIQDIVDYLATLHAENSMTYNEMSSKNKTYNQLYGLKITYTQLYRNGKLLYI